jgi:hypothetical protein
MFPFAPGLILVVSTTTRVDQTTSGPGLTVLVLVRFTHDGMHTHQMAHGWLAERYTVGWLR